MADPQYPLTNGHRYDFSSTETSIKNKKVLGLKAIDYGHKLTPGKVTGASAQKLGTTRGTYEPNGSLEMWLHEWEELKAALGDGYLEKRFDIVHTYAETGAPTITDRLVACRITDVQKSGASDSSDAISVKLELDVTYLIENGKKPLEKMRL